MIPLLAAILAAGFNAHASRPAAQPAMIDLTRAVVLSDARPNTPESKAVQMLVEEVEKRTRVRWPITNDRNRLQGVYIWIARAAGTSVAHRAPTTPFVRPEGYFLRTLSGSPQITVVGHDSRGVLFGVGRLLRELRMSRDHIEIPADLRLATSPYHSLRGHQLGYRPKTNSYDAWTVPMWEQYIRDLVVFGANAVELIPPRSDDDADSPHFPLPPMRMMIEMSKLLNAYGLDVWIWYPALDKDYTDPKTVEFALKEWGDVFRQLPRVDAVFVPGGDPGHTEPKVLMALLEKQTANLHKYHPKAQMWVSPQGFTQAWMDQFIGILQNQRPKWLTGVVFGPQVRTPLPKLRELVPKQYPIRHYPDITHSMQCQFPVENWDVAYALTEGREGINPRPMAEATICRWHQPYTIGSITYSEGCNDDVNKAIWSALEWDPKADVKEILRQYSRYFISNPLADRFADGLLALERNWQGPIELNSGIVETHQLFEQLEKVATPQDKLNWRFQQALYRANYDAYMRNRRSAWVHWERFAVESLKLAKNLGEIRAIKWPGGGMMGRGLPPPYDDLNRPRIFELAEALFQSIRMQLSVTRYGAISVWRGANLDSIDHPAGSLDWLRDEVRRINAVRDDNDRYREFIALANRTDPGPDGFYDDLGDPNKRQHVVQPKPFEEDPGHMESVRIGFEEDYDGRIEWARFAETLYDTPLRMRYTGLDTKAQYRLRVVYGPNNPQIKLRCVANEKWEVHGWFNKPKPTKPVEFDVPPEATATGELTLTWTREPGLGGNGRGCQLCEVWLLKK